MACKKEVFVKKHFNSITGLSWKEYTKGWHLVTIDNFPIKNEEGNYVRKFEVWNKDNSCKYFKNKIFWKKSNKVYCKDCKFWGRFIV